MSRRNVAQEAKKLNAPIGPEALIEEMVKRLLSAKRSKDKAKAEELVKEWIDRVTEWGKHENIGAILRGRCIAFDELAGDGPIALTRALNMLCPGMNHQNIALPLLRKYLVTNKDYFTKRKDFGEDGMAAAIGLWRKNGMPKGVLAQLWLGSEFQDFVAKARQAGIKKKRANMKRGPRQPKKARKLPL